MRGNIRKWMVVGALASASLLFPACSNTNRDNAGGAQTETGTGGAGSVGMEDQGIGGAGGTGDVGMEDQGIGGAGGAGGAKKGAKGAMDAGMSPADAGTAPMDAGTGGAGLGDDNQELGTPGEGVSGDQDVNDSPGGTGGVKR
ncbi:hypothetical protein JRI60_06430 [Archangium violaceum]|uniref:hypothetical protein n=1 Tax=Archangium violaceum TaxID=83451 RepID=UPI001950057D|nr:hypothetical protein [Archangium violaceum]QRN98679.1 hypothetical protein JRI60_06430 [Archangium violaceum]